MQHSNISRQTVP